MAVGELTIRQTDIVVEMTLGQPSKAKCPLYERSLDESTWYHENHQLPFSNFNPSAIKWQTSLSSASWQTSSLSQPIKKLVEMEIPIKDLKVTKNEKVFLVKIMISYTVWFQETLKVSFWWNDLWHQFISLAIKQLTFLVGQLISLLETDENRFQKYLKVFQSYTILIKFEILEWILSKIHFHDNM